MLLVPEPQKLGYAGLPVPVVVTIRLVSLMRHFLKYAKRINAKYAAEICGNVVQNCSKPTTPSRSTEVRTHEWCHSVVNQMVEVTKPNRNR